MNYRYLFLSALLVVALACNTNKKTSATNKTTTTKGEPAVAPEQAPADYVGSARRENDLLHTKLDLHFDYAKRWVMGKATISARPYFAATNTLSLDARGMEIREVAMLSATGKQPLKYTYADDKLVIDLGRKYTRSEMYTVFIDYIAKPDELKTVGGSAAINSDKGMYFINPDGKVPNKPVQIWSQGETQSNSVWFPTIDRTNERMTDEIYLTVEDKYKTLSNGLLTDSKKNSDGTRTDHWQMNLPHAPYLVMIAVGDFAVVKDSWKGIEVSYYVEPQYEQYAKAIFGKTPQMIDFFSKRLGVDYAWPKYSQLCVRDFVSGAMENTTATVHGDFVQHDDREILDRSFEEYISHELFHQWFGDLVTCESWPNLPLNESFATYGEYLWNEHTYGREFADREHYDSQRGYLFEAASGKVEPLIRYHLADREDMFDGHSYNKGGQVLHMLRTYMGDDAFFAGLKLYLERNKFRAVEIHDLRLAMEEVSGEDLNWFFNQWFLAPGHPELEISYAYDNVRQEETVTMKQVQNRTKGTPLFRLPLKVDIYVNGKVERHDIDMTKETQSFVFSASSKPDLVNVDAEKTLLCTKKDQHTPEEWAFQYAHAPLFLDRLEALNGLAKKTAETDLAVQVVGKALSDKFFGIREVAAEKIGEKGATANKAQLIKLAQTDSVAAVRVNATRALSRWAWSEDEKEFFLGQLNDRSFRVVSTALEALVDHWHDLGMAEAKKLENKPERGYKLAVANAYVNGGKDEQQPWFEKTMTTISGRQQGQFLYAYASFLTNCSDETVKKALPAIEKIYTTEDGPGAKMAVKSVFGILAGHYGAVEKDAQEKAQSLKAAKSDATGLAAVEQKRDAAKAMKEYIQERKMTLK